MKLLTDALERRFAQVGSQDESKDPLIIAKFLNPTGAGTWYATELTPKPAPFSVYLHLRGLER